MKSDVAAGYEALELQPGASEQDVKRAYFRLVRKYTPEKDPERFQKIRAAYELLKDGPVEEPSELYDMPANPRACLNIEGALDLMKQGRFEVAVKLFQEALDIEPDSPVALAGMATALYRSGKPQKAAKAAERLIQLLPNDTTAHVTLAMSLYSRGWYKKALPAFRRAYELGARELPFLADYTAAARDNGQREECVRVAREILSNAKWNKDNVYYAIDAYGAIGEQGSLRGTAFAEWAQSLCDFIIRNQRLIDSGEMALYPLYLYLDDDGSMDCAAFNAIAPILDRIEREAPAWKKEAEIIREKAIEFALENDSRLLHNEDWVLLIGFTASENSEFEDKGICHYDKLSAQLCFLRKWDAVSQEIPIIQRDYPALYGYCRDFLEQAASEGPDVLFTRLRREFEKLSRHYEGSVYQKRYPEEFAPAGRVIADGEDFTPYVRTNAKIGANDPCPCGSGKKFKKCCMGTGKYD